MRREQIYRASLSITFVFTLALVAAARGGDTYVVSIDMQGQGVHGNQAEQAADTLKNQGVTSDPNTTKLSNPTSQQITDAIDALRNRLHNGDQLVVIFNGHGSIVADDDPPGTDEDPMDYIEPENKKVTGRFDKAWVTNGGFLRDDALADALKRNLPACAVAVIVAPSCMGMGMFDGGKKNIKQSVPNVIVGAPPGSKNKVETAFNCIDNFVGLRDGFDKQNPNNPRQKKSAGSWADLNNDGKVTTEEWMKAAGLDVQNNLDSNHTVPTLTSNLPIESPPPRVNQIKSLEPQKLEQNPSPQTPKTIILPFSGNRSTGAFQISPVRAVGVPTFTTATSGATGQRLITTVGRDFLNTRQTHYSIDFDYDAPLPYQTLGVGRTYHDGRLVDASETGGELFDLRFQTDFPSVMPRGLMTIGFQLVQKDTMKVILRARALFNGQTWVPVGTWDNLPPEFADFAGNPATGTDYIVGGVNVLSIRALEALPFATSDDLEASQELADAMQAGATLVNDPSGGAFVAFYNPHFEFVLPEALALSSNTDYIFALDMAQAVPTPAGVGIATTMLMLLRRGARRRRFV